MIEPISELSFDDWTDLRDQVLAASGAGGHVLIHSRVGIRAGEILLNYSTY